MVQYGGFWRRFIAYLIDSIIVNVAAGVVGAAVGIGPSMMAVMLGNTVNDATDALSGLIGLVTGWLYFALMESSANQATVGKMALGMTVTDLEGHRISFGRATGRYFAKILSALILLIGFIMAAFTERKQGLHDMLAGTLVVKAKPGQAVTSANVFE